MTPELSRPLAIEAVGAGGLSREVVAGAAECAAVAARLLLPAVAALSCRFQLAREGSDGRVVVATGQLTARLTQVCVVSLDEFEADLTETFRIRFVPDGTQEEEGDPESDDEIPYLGASIDLGEATVEQLALTLDPYPRKPDAVLPEEELPDAVVHPFAALAACRKGG